MAQTSSVRGTLIDLDANISVDSATVILSGEKTFETISDGNGVFQLSNVPFGKYELIIKKEGYDEITRALHLIEKVKNLGLIILSGADENPERFAQDNIPVISISESHVSDNSSQNVSGVLNASRDAFISVSSFNWGAARFRIRGYEGENFVTLFNGAPMNDLTTGLTHWSLWSGLNDVLRNRENSLGLAPSTFSFGSVGGSYDLDSRAARQRKQLSVSYAVSNRTYSHRLMTTYSSGLLKNNWAISLSFSKRFGRESCIPGTYFDGYSYFASAEKLIGFKHSISLTALGAPAKNGRSSPSVNEMNDLAGTNYYNPNWGYQNGEKRNAVVAKIFQPVVVVNHEWKFSKESSLESAVSFLFGKNSVSALDWYNAPDPRPDYYRRLPSYIDDSTLQQEAKYLLSSSDEARQLNWANLYNVNYHNIETVARGVSGDSVTGKHSLYILQNRVIYNQRLAVNTVYNNSISEHLLLTAGASYQRQTSEFYEEADDLLGGDFFLDLNLFA
ncbi:MAG TPA: carboxypeptidase regulatory-like domain-containing protein, partial [Chitinophagales bacterium]|nr:carboxypeptidase regulatory-like domain-containing protein [Chitinophagales bacterium]